MFKTYRGKLAVNMLFPAESSNTLFHFTSSETNLISILENNFQPRWGLEDLTCVIPDRGNFPHPEGYIYSFPKVCFCDLPLSRTGRHMKIYKNYGIGLTKEWGKKNGLNPVLYVHTDSHLAQDIFRTNVLLTEESLKIDDFGFETQEEWEEAIRDHSIRYEGTGTINYFIKPYEGDFSHAGEVHSNVRFYDEREWRFVPRCEEPGKVFMCFKEQFDELDPQEITALNAGIPTLNFEPDDIRYLIVERQEEILPLVDHVMRIKAKYTDDQKRLLTTRIVSAEQIREDF